MAKEKICAACEREKAKIPTYSKLAKQRAVEQGRTTVIYLDEEDIKYRITDLETARTNGYSITAYFTPL